MNNASSPSPGRPPVAPPSPASASRKEPTGDARHCPDCGLPFHPGAMPGGMCPRCLLGGLGAADENVWAHAQAQEPPTIGPVLIPRPSVEALAAEFPGYTVESLLGSGGMGAVYRARHRELDRPLAIKILLINTATDPAFEERFRREARVMARLDHPNIVRIHDFGRTPGGLCFLTMELVEGVNIAQLIRRKELPVPGALVIVGQICDALQCAHGLGFVHRDIKPSNILVARDGQVKIADFGLAKLLGAEAASDDLTLDGTALGTPYYTNSI